MKVWRILSALAFDVYAVCRVFILIGAAAYQLSVIEGSPEGGYTTAFHFNLTGGVLLLFVLSLLALAVCLTVAAFRREISRKTAAWLLGWMGINLVWCALIPPQTYAATEYAVVWFSRLPIAAYAVVYLLAFVFAHTAVTIWLTDRITVSVPQKKWCGRILCIVGAAGSAAAVVSLVITTITTLASTADSPAIGIIGGADGSTATFLTHQLILQYWFGYPPVGWLLCLFPLVLMVGIVLRIRARHVDAL